MPFVASSLLQAGLSDFSLSAGALRQNYGYRSANYGQWVASGGRYGVTDWLTLEGRRKALLSWRSPAPARACARAVRGPQRLLQLQRAGSDA